MGDCLALLDALEAKIRPGVTCGELYELGQQQIRNASYPEYGWNIIHGVGMVPHEPPVARRSDSEYVLRQGMVMSIEAQYQHPEVGDVKVEDIVAVTADGCENFTTAGRGWTVVD